jgi:hypothetical protein
MRKVPNSEEDQPPNSRIRVAATIDDRLLAEMRRIHVIEVAEAKRCDRADPDWSNTVEMLLRKGVKAYKFSHSPE